MVEYPMVALSWRVRAAVSREATLGALPEESVVRRREMGATRRPKRRKE